MLGKEHGESAREISVQSKRIPVGDGLRTQVTFDLQDRISWIIRGDGSLVPIQQAFSTLLPAEISQRTGRKVELYNEAIVNEGGVPRTVDLRIGSTLADKPDMILWVLTPRDINDAALTVRLFPTLPTRHELNTYPEVLADIKSCMSKLSTSNTIPPACHDVFELALSIRFSFQASRIRLLLRHFLYMSQSLYVKSYLMNGDDAAFLRTDLSSEWKQRLQQFNGYDLDIEARARAAGVPVAVVLVPDRAQAVMISMGEWPSGYDPYKLGEELRTIVTSHGGNFIDLLPEFRNIPNSVQGYFPVDGHPNAYGHAMISSILAKELTSGTIPGLKFSAQSQVASKHRE